jgi:hypothetical protein
MTANFGDDDSIRELTKIVEDLFKGFGLPNYHFPGDESSPEESAWKAAVQAWFFEEIMTFRRDLEHLLTTLPEVLGSDPTEVLDLSGCARIEANINGRKYMIVIEPMEDEEFPADMLSLDISGIDFDQLEHLADDEVMFSPDFLEEWE